MATCADDRGLGLRSKVQVERRQEGKLFIYTISISPSKFEAFLLLSEALTLAYRKV